MNDTITITGNLAADPELRRTSQGVPVVNFRVGSSVRRFDKSEGVWNDESTNWYSVSAFRALGQNAFQSLRKGSPVVVSGRLVLRSWESNGTTRTSADIEAEAIGHDLRWGAITLERSAGDDGASSSTREDGGGDGEPWKVSGAVKEWETATPGAAEATGAPAESMSSTGSADGGSVSEPEREAAGVGGPF